MDELLIDIIKQRFNDAKAQDLFIANEMLTNFNYTLHIEQFNDLLGTDAIDNSDIISTRILEIFEQSIYDVLVTLFIVPEVTSFNPLYALLTQMYKLENYSDHQVVLDEIDDMVYLNSPRETLIHLLDKLIGADWATLNENIQEVRQTLITMLVNKHTKDVEVEPNDTPDNLIKIREVANTRFFTTHPNTIIAQFVVQGMLPVPVESDKALATVTSTIYRLEDINLIALEMLALAFIAPVKLSSIPLQAKSIVNQLYIDVNTVTQLSLAIDKIVKDGDLLNEQ